ncbi:hypothetical protein B0H13DRAFT_1896486 [Mycena leptocephala]|nr:hypothetical protein B0H13DRAFT_1896486 [Mycena leptocephala]
MRRSRSRRCFEKTEKKQGNNGDRPSEHPGSFKLTSTSSPPSLLFPCPFSHPTVPSRHTPVVSRCKKLGASGVPSGKWKHLPTLSAHVVVVVCGQGWAWFPTLALLWRNQEGVWSDVRVLQRRQVLSLESSSAQQEKALAQARLSTPENYCRAGQFPAPCNTSTRGDARGMASGREGEKVPKHASALSSPRRKRWQEEDEGMITKTDEMENKPMRVSGQAWGVKTRLFGGETDACAVHPRLQPQNYDLERKREERVAAESTSGCKRIGGGECEDASYEDASVQPSSGPHLAAFPSLAPPVPAADSRWKIRAGKKCYARCTQERAVAHCIKSSEALRIEAHYVWTTGDEDEKKPGKK